MEYGVGPGYYSYKDISIYDIEMIID